MTMESTINFPNGINNGKPLPVGIVSGHISVSSGAISLYTSSGAVSNSNPLPVDITSMNQFNFQIGRLLNGTSETLTVAFAPTSANTKVLADLAWFEIV